MLRSIFDAFDKLRNIENRSIEKILDQIDIQLLETMCTFLKFFLDQRTSLSNANEITLHKVLPVKFALKSHIEKSDLDSVIKQNFLESLESKLVISNYHLVASFLFPYFFFQCKASTFSDSDLDKIEETLLKISIKFQVKSLLIEEEPTEIQTIQNYEDFIVNQIEIVVSSFDQNKKYPNFLKLIDTLPN